jgi:hypothetical protein
VKADAHLLSVLDHELSLRAVKLYVKVKVGARTVHCLPNIQPITGKLKDSKLTVEINGF